MNAVVVGATGAVGSQLVLQLLQSSAWSSVRTVGRRELTLPPAQDASKLEQITLDMDTLASRADAFTRADVCFCTLGTTRAAAGSAEAFIKVDVDYVAAAAEAAKVAGVPHFSLLTAGGANAKLPDVRWAPLHGILYARCKGLAEQSVINKGFRSVSILRPGLIARGSHARSIEKVALWVASSISAAEVATAMMRAAEEPREKALVTYNMQQMQQLARQR